MQLYLQHLVFVRPLLLPAAIVYATLHSLFYLETALHVSGGTSTHHQERMQLYLQHLVFVTPLLLPVEHVQQFPDINKLCKVASCWIYIGIYLRCTDP